MGSLKRSLFFHDEDFIMGSLKRSLFAAQNVFGAVTEEIELRGFASTPLRIAQIIAIGLEYWNDGLRRKKRKNPYLSF